ncbi:MAG TPA: VWA domain-containing protein [Candidatus Acidoferrales bacterium]|nr:VWA domain-containing protein [Candidatus Acidoferrales bacterium]
MRKLNQKGSMLVFMTVGFALLGTFVGFALDFGRAYVEKARISRLVDGAALAAAKVLKGQPGYEDEATRAACDSMVMNGAKVAMSGAGACAGVAGSNINVAISFFDAPAPGGPAITNVQVTGTEPVPTTFLRFLGFLTPGDFSTINVAAIAQAGPERPIDLMLVLDRSGSMTSVDGTGTPKINALKTAVNQFIGLSNTFSSDDRIGMTSFSSRGCGVSGQDSTSTGVCQPDSLLDFASSSQITSLQGKINALVASGGTNTMEAIQTARNQLAPAFDDPTRATTRKAMLLVTDGQPTFMRRNSDADCKHSPRDNSLLPSNGSGNGGGGPFTNGCTQGVPTYTSSSSNPWMYREKLGSTSCYVAIPGTWTSTACPGSQSVSSNAQLYKDVIRCTRSLVNCVTNGAMYEANVTRNCGYDNSACGTGGAHDIVIYSIVIGQNLPNDPQNSVDANAKCLLARMSNATDILNASTGVVEAMTDVCNAKFTSVDGDTHADLVESWPCATGPCIDSTQEKGKVYIIDMNGNVAAQLNLVFQEIASLLKLRLLL